MLSHQVIPRRSLRKKATVVPWRRAAMINGNFDLDCEF
jgi:hypothetical protein